MEYGKFTSAEQLLKSYNELQKAFTQKCQQLAALQQQNATADGTSLEPPIATVGTETSDQVATIPQEEPTLIVEQSCSNADRQPTPQEIEQYLLQNPNFVLQLFNSRMPTAPQIMTSGGAVQLTMPSRPKTIKEAGELARKYVSKQNS